VQQTVNPTAFGFLTEEWDNITWKKLAFCRNHGDGPASRWNLQQHFCRLLDSAGFAGLGLMEVIYPDGKLDIYTS